MDKRSVTSRENGKKGGRPPQFNLDRVIAVLLRGLKRIAAVPEPKLESVDMSLAHRRLRNSAVALVSAFENVITQSRVVYLEELEKLSRPNSVDVQEQLRQKLDLVSREVRQYLRVISVKAEVILQDLNEQNIQIDADVLKKLEKLSKLEAKDLGDVVELIVGIVEESLDPFGIPIFS